MAQKQTGGPAFPRAATQYINRSQEGMTLRDYFAGQALANPEICTGVVDEWQLRIWFGDRCGITRAEIVSKQAFEYADAMIAARDAQ